VYMCHSVILVVIKCGGHQHV